MCRRGGVDSNVRETGRVESKSPPPPQLRMKTCATGSENAAQMRTTIQSHFLVSMRVSSALVLEPMWQVILYVVNTRRVQE